MTDDLIKRLRNFAQGCRGSMWQSSDETIELCDQAAAALEAAQAEKFETLSRLAGSVAEVADLTRENAALRAERDHWEVLAIVRDANQRRAQSERDTALAGLSALAELERTKG